MDRTMKGEIYARAHRKALEHFSDNPNEDALDELTLEYFEDEYPDYEFASQAHLEIASDGEAEANNNNGDSEEGSDNEEPENDNPPDEDVPE